MTERQQLLIFCDYYPPAYLAGGPPKSISEIASRIGDELDVHVITSAFDLGTSQPLPIPPNTPYWRGNHLATYCSSLRALIFTTWGQLSQHPRPSVYLNSTFSSRYSTVPLLMTRVRGLLDRKPAHLVIAPRGELAPSALAISPRRKRLYLHFLRWTGLAYAACWHATASHEQEWILRHFPGAETRIVGVPIRPGGLSGMEASDRTDQYTGPLRLIFLARIKQNKNLHGALQALREVNAQVRLTIAGPAEDETYWRKCQELIGGLPENVTVDYVGPIEPDSVRTLLSSHDLLYLPTQGENFGHVILESLASGTPVVIGTNTPWGPRIENRAGWVVDADDIAGQTRLLERLARHGREELLAMRREAGRTATEVASGNAGLTTDYVKLLTPARRVSVTLIQRRPHRGQHSVERVFRDVVSHLPDSIEPAVTLTPRRGARMGALLRNALFAARRRHAVAHVTGDVQYLVPFLRCRGAVLTVLDLGSLHAMSGLKRAAFRTLWYTIPLRKATVVTTISEQVARELRTEFPAIEHKLHVVPCPVSPIFLAATRRKDEPPSSIDGARVLQVGARSNKNFETVAHALSGLPVELRVIGELTTSQHALLDRLAVRYSSVANLSDAELLEEYLAADVLTFVSTYEGFGLPIVEAQAVGLPVITSRLEPMTSVAGPDGALLVDPHEPAQIREAILALLRTDAVRATVVEAGFLNAQRYRPDVIASRYAALYESMAI